MKIEKKEELGKYILDLINGKKVSKVVKSTGQNEATAADGGNTVFHDIIPDILSANFAEGSLYADCKHYTVGPKANGLKIPVSLETTRSSTNVKGGFRAYIVGEGSTKTPSHGHFGQLDLALKKAAAVVYVTDELKQDSVSLSSYVYDAQKEAIMALIDYNIIQGDGTLLNGIVSEPCTGFVTCADPLTNANLRSILKLYYGGKNGKWYLSKVRWNQILDLFETQIADTDAPAGVGIMLHHEDGAFYLFGYEVVVSDVMLDNQILLADLSQYAVVEKGLRTDINESLKFVEDESILRSVFRINGAGIWRHPITLADGSVTHPFVMSEDYVNSSSESSSSQSSLSSSSSSSVDSSSSSSSSSRSSASSGSTASSASSSSKSSNSSSSSSSNSSSSVSSASSDSSSSLSSESSDSSSSVSSSSESSSSVSTNSSESSAHNRDVCASTFTTVAYNGTYTPNGSTYGSKEIYSNGTWLLWYDPITGYWAMSNTAGDPQNQWKSSKDVAGGDTPVGTWADEDGLVAAGACP